MFHLNCDSSGPIAGLLAEAHGIINERNEALAQLGRQIQEARVLVGVMNKVPSTFVWA